MSRFTLFTPLVLRALSLVVICGFSLALLLQVVHLTGWLALPLVISTLGFGYVVLVELRLRQTTAQLATIASVGVILVDPDSLHRRLPDLVKSLVRFLRLRQASLVMTAADGLIEIKGDRQQVITLETKERRHDETRPKFRLTQGEAFAIGAETQARGHLWIRPQFALSQLEKNRLREFCSSLSRLLDEQHLLADQRYLANHDHLTGCFNANSFYQSLDQRLQLEAGWTVVGLMDIDNLKQTNDQHGHEIGDQMIQSVGQRLQAAIPADGIAARLHGDEFAWWFPCAGATAAQLQARTQALHRSICQPLANSGVPVSVSIGAVIVAAGTSFKEATHLSDQAMYQSKHSGKGKAILVPPQIDKPIQ